MDRKTDPCNRRESLEIDPHIYNHQIYHKSDTTVQWKKDDFFKNSTIMGLYGYYLRTAYNLMVKHSTGILPKIRNNLTLY